MFNTNITPQFIVDYLNELLELDSEMMHEFCFNRFKCNEKIAEHPTVQVTAYGKQSDKYMVGLIGFLNGLIGVDVNSIGCIEAQVEKDSSYKSGYKILYFQLNEERLKKL